MHIVCQMNYLSLGCINRSFIDKKFTSTNHASYSSAFAHENYSTFVLNKPFFIATVQWNDFGEFSYLKGIVSKSRLLTTHSTLLEISVILLSIPLLKQDLTFTDEIKLYGKTLSVTTVPNSALENHQPIKWIHFQLCTT